MPTKIKIRKNNITGQWEHWVSTTNSEGYWAPELYGNNQNNSQLLANTSNIDNRGNVVYYEEFDNDPFPVPTKITTYNVSDLNKYTDREFTEYKEDLVITEKCQDVPIATTIYEISRIQTPESAVSTNLDSGGAPLNQTIFHNTWDLSSEFENNYIFVSQSMTLNVSASNPCTESTSMIYSWILDEAEFSSANKDASLTLPGTQKDIDQKTVLCKLDNLVGSTIAHPLNLTVCNPWFSKYFGKNLIKNPFGKDGLAHWTANRGQPKTYPVFEDFKKEGFFDYKLFADFFKQTNIDAYPSISELTYFTGGEATPDFQLSTMYQVIDISEIKNYVDKKIVGLEQGIFVNVFALLGKWGTSGAWNINLDPLLVFDPPGVYGGLTQGYIPSPIFNWKNATVDHQYPLAVYYDLYEKDPQTAGEVHVIDSQYAMSRANYQIGDKSRIKVSFLDENDVVIQQALNSGTDSFITLPKQLWIRGSFLDVPVGTRKIRIDLEFEKDFDIHVTDRTGMQDSPLEVYQSNPGVLYNVRPWEAGGDDSKLTMHLDHLSMITGVFCELGLKDGWINPENSPLQQYYSAGRASKRPAKTLPLIQYPPTPIQVTSTSMKSWYVNKNGPPAQLFPNEFVNCSYAYEQPPAWDGNNHAYLKNSPGSFGWVTYNGLVYKCQIDHFSNSSNAPEPIMGDYMKWRLITDPVLYYVQQQCDYELEGFTLGNGIFDIWQDGNVVENVKDSTNCKSGRYFKATCTPETGYVIP